jgi:phenylacetic acid degradation operon negative regulatory protein
VGKTSPIKHITYEIFGSVFDLLLYQVFLVGASFGKTGSRGVYRAFSEADALLEKVNHHTLATTWHQLTKRRLVTNEKRGRLYFPTITKLGKQRLRASLPFYQENRPWDGRIYLITFDIPENVRSTRNQLRQFLMKIGCKLLQESVWITPYNPRELINEWVREHKIPGTIVVSDTGHDGGIGEDTMQDLLIRVYKLEELNDRYQEFLEEVQERNKPPTILISRYLSILKDDPQLPFQLVPKGFLAGEAYKMYQKLCSEYISLVVRPHAS